MCNAPRTPSDPFLWRLSAPRRAQSVKQGHKPGASFPIDRRILPARRRCPIPPSGGICPEILCEKADSPAVFQAFSDYTMAKKWGMIKIIVLLLHCQNGGRAIEAEY